MAPEVSFDSMSSPLPEIAHVVDESKVSDACFQWVREYKKIVPDLSLSSAIATLDQQLADAQLLPDICAHFLSTLIVRFDSIEPYDALERAKLLHDQIETSDLRLPSHLSNLPVSTVGIYRELAAFVACLQVVNNGPAHCSCRVAGDLLDVSHEMANRHLVAMEKLGILVRTENHTRTLAREYVISDEVQIPKALSVDTRTHHSITHHSTTHDPTTHDSPHTNSPATELIATNTNTTKSEVAVEQHDWVERELQPEPAIDQYRTGQVIPFARAGTPVDSRQQRTPGSQTDSQEVTCEGCKKNKVSVASVPPQDMAVLCDECDAKVAAMSKKPKDRLLHFYDLAIEKGSTEQEARLSLAHAVATALNATARSSIEQLLNWFEALTPNAVVDEVVEVVGDKSVRNAFVVLNGRCKNIAAKKRGGVR